MPRVLACLVVLALLAGCGEDEAEAPAPTSTASPSALADLTLTVDFDGPDRQAPKQVEVVCNEAQDSALCTDVAAIDPKAFEPTPRMTACTQQYGGPETARVVGTFRGKPVDARFSREQGCEIARWDEVVAVLDRNPIP